MPIQTSAKSPHWRSYFSAVSIIALCTGMAGVMAPHFAPINLCMVYFVGVVIVAVRYGLGPSLLASLLSVAAFDFFFIVPYLTLVVADSQYVLTFGVMLFVAVTISALTARVKMQAEAASEREQQTAILYEMSQDFARGNLDRAMDSAARHLHRLFDSGVMILLPGPHNQVQCRSEVGSAGCLSDQE